MRQAAVLVGAFALTLGVLLGGYLALGGGQPAAPVALVSPSPSVTPRPSPRPTPTRSIAPSPSVAPSASASSAPTPDPSWSAIPLMSGSPSFTPVPDTTSGTSLTVTVLGRSYTAFDVQPNSKVTQLPSGSALLESTMADSNPTSVMYQLPPSSVPIGRTIARLDTVVCGSGGGNFWEVYGPDGSDPTEYEAQKPGTDGCWHFTRAPGTDTSVHADVQLASSFRIDKVVFTVWLR